MADANLADNRAQAGSGALATASHIAGIQAVFCICLPLAFVSLVTFAAKTSAGFVDTAGQVHAGALNAPVWWVTEGIIYLGLALLAISQRRSPRTPNLDFLQIAAIALILATPVLPILFVAERLSFCSPLSPRGLLIGTAISIPVLLACFLLPFLTSLLFWRRFQRLRWFLFVTISLTLILGIYHFHEEPDSVLHSAIAAVLVEQCLLFVLARHSTGANQNELTSLERMGLAWRDVSPSLLWAILMPVFVFLLLVLPLVTSFVATRENPFYSWSLLSILDDVVDESILQRDGGFIILSVLVLISWAMVVPALASRQGRQPDWLTRTLGALNITLVAPLFLNAAAVLTIEELFGELGDREFFPLLLLPAAVAILVTAVGTVRFVSQRRAASRTFLIRGNLVILALAGTVALLVTGLPLTSVTRGLAGRLSQLVIPITLVAGILIPAGFGALLPLVQGLSPELDECKWEREGRPIPPPAWRFRVIRALAVIAVTGALYQGLVHDDPAGVAQVLVSYKPIPAADNLFADLGTLEVDLEQMDVLAPIARGLAPWDDDLVGRVLPAHQYELQAAQQALQRPRCQFPKVPDDSTPLPYLPRWYRLSVLMALQTESDFRAGRLADAMDGALRLIRFAFMMQSGDGVAIHFAIGERIRAMGFRQLRLVLQQLPLTRAQVERLQTELKTLEVQEEDAWHACCRDYEAFRNTLLPTLKEKQEEYGAFYVRPRETTAYHAADLAEKLSSADLQLGETLGLSGFKRSYRQTDPQGDLPINVNTPLWKLAITPNAVGRLTYSVSRDSWTAEVVLRSLWTSQARQRCIDTALRLALEEHRDGKLPEAIMPQGEGKLLTVLFGSPPERSTDPWRKGSWLGYRPKDRIVYSVGRNQRLDLGGKDDSDPVRLPGGEEQQEPWDWTRPGPEKDIVFVIPRIVKASDQDRGSED